MRPAGSSCTAKAWSRSIRRRDTSRVVSLLTASVTYMLSCSELSQELPTSCIQLSPRDSPAQQAHVVLPDLLPCDKLS